jgi:hypothetical protein
VTNAAIQHTARCAQNISGIRDPILILSILRYLHEQEFGQIEQDHATTQGTDQHTAARATSIGEYTTGGEIYNLFLPTPLSCYECADDLEKSLRITVISLCRLIRLGKYDAFEEQLERVCPR